MFLKDCFKNLFRMRLMFRLVFIYVLLLDCDFLVVVHAQPSINAVIPGDFADPSIIKKGNQYYAVGTSSEWAPHFPIFTSTNLISWKQTGYVFDKKPEWTTGSFWAPEYYFHNNTYFIYYTARRKTDNTSYIGVATSKFPDKGFVDRGVIIEHGKEAIDAFVFNDNGQLYITFKAYGLDERPIEILGSKLSANGLKLEGELFSMMKDEKRMGLEGQSILKKDGFYYLFYSAGNCCGTGCSYNVGVARATNFKGPYENYAANPILHENGDWKCSGHGTFVRTTDNKDFYLYHAYSKTSTVFAGRQGMLAELVWNDKDGWPKFEVFATNPKSRNLIDLFQTKKLANYWQWDFRNATPNVTITKGNLFLSGNAKLENKTGVVLTVRPSAASFEATTTVVNYNGALKGLAYYGDANAALGVGVVNDCVVFWIVKNNQFNLINSVNISKNTPVELKMELLQSQTCRAYYKLQNESWQQITSTEPLSTSFLPQWDRSPRIGLHFKGSNNLNAQFELFKLNYK
jgi:beta-xylosidase